MPFKSKAQMRYMFSNMPKLAKEWADKYGVPKKLPEKKKSSTWDKVAEKEKGK